MSNTDLKQRAATLDADLRGAPIGSYAGRPVGSVFQNAAVGYAAPERNLVDFLTRLHEFRGRLNRLSTDSRGVYATLTGNPVPPEQGGMARPVGPGLLGELHETLFAVELECSDLEAVLQGMRAAVGPVG